MSDAILPRPRLGVSKRQFVIVCSQFNANYVQGLIDHTMEELRRLAPNAGITWHQVPGAFEIPVVVRELAVHKKADVIVALGVILKGQTDHAINLSRSVTDALQRIAIDHGVPVINGILTVENEAQAQERCLGETINRGTEAARAAVEIAGVMADLREK
jgi:6,7-dimethyl-8-ribityllumazine synthase